METIKAGRLDGIKYVVNKNGTTESAAIISTAYNTHFQVKLPDMNKDDFLKKLIEENDLAITDMDTFFQYVDFKDNIAFKTNFYNDDINYLNIAIRNFEDEIYSDIRQIISAMNVNCIISNIGFSPNMNILKLKGDITLDGYNATQIFPIELSYFTDFNGNDLEDILKSQEIACVENTIFELDNSWINEWWNGPQSHGGYMMYNKVVEQYKSEVYDYDFTFQDLKPTKVFFNENTIINLNGNKENGVEILCPLKNLHLLEEFSSKKDVYTYTFDGLGEDMECALRLPYIRNQYINESTRMSIEDLIQRNALALEDIER